MKLIIGGLACAAGVGLFAFVLMRAATVHPQGKEQSYPPLSIFTESLEPVELEPAGLTASYIEQLRTLTRELPAVGPSAEKEHDQ